MCFSVIFFGKKISRMKISLHKRWSYFPVSLAVIRTIGLAYKGTGRQSVSEVYIENLLLAVIHNLNSIEVQASRLVKAPLNQEQQNISLLLVLLSCGNIIAITPNRSSEVVVMLSSGLFRLRNRFTF